MTKTTKTPTARDLLERALAEHKSDAMGDCVTCLSFSQWDDVVMQGWPCPTRRALLQVLEMLGALD